MGVVLFLLAAFVFVCEGTKTTFSFSRKINTCDIQDRPLQNATSKVIWSYNDNDPVNPETILYHQKRGVASVRFLNPSTTEPDLPSDVEFVDITQNNSTITFSNSVHGPTTQYWCTAHKVEFTAKRHIIRVEPVILPQFTQQIHHILLYQCKDGLDETALNYQGGCYVANMPASVYKCKGEKTVHAWAIGGTPYDFPENVGLPLGPGTSYFVLEVHIENPTLVPMVDNSGVRFFTTGMLRTYDAGVAAMGVRVDPRLTIPPQQADYVYDGLCPAACTQMMYPAEGIKILSGGLHTHIAGRKIFWHHYRDNQELPPLLEEPYYDFNYQDYTFFDPPIDFLPGDEMTLDCHYDTTMRATPTPMGLSTQEEMCLTFFVYYPAVTAEECDYANLTDFQEGTTVAWCAGNKLYNVTQQPYTPYVAPPCNYVAPNPERMTPTLRSGPINPNDYERSQFLDDEQKYKLYWTINKTALTLSAAVEVETTGWVGLGISPNGMEGADVLIGWVKDGQVFFADRFATAKMQPPVDALQDYYDITGGEYTETASSNQSWIEKLDRAVIAVFFTGVGAVLVFIMGCVYFRYKRRQEKNEYFGLDDEGRTSKESVMLGDNQS